MFDISRMLGRRFIGLTEESLPVKESRTIVIQICLRIFKFFVDQEFCGHE